MYHLVMRTQEYGPLGEKWAWPPHALLWVLGFKTQPKVDPLRGPFGSTIISKFFCENFRPEPPLTPLNHLKRLYIRNDRD